MSLVARIFLWICAKRVNFFSINVFSIKPLLYKCVTRTSEIALVDNIYGFSFFFLFSFLSSEYTLANVRILFGHCLDACKYKEKMIFVYIGITRRKTKDRVSLSVQFEFDIAFLNHLKLVFCRCTSVLNCLFKPEKMERTHSHT